MKHVPHKEPVLDQKAYGLATAQVMCFYEDEWKDKELDWYGHYKELVAAVSEEREPIGMCVWEPIEDWTWEHALNHIDSEAETIKETIKECWRLAMVAMVSDAEDGTFPLDINELNFEGLMHLGTVLEFNDNNEA